MTNILISLHEISEWFLKQKTFKFLYLQLNDADTQPTQSLLLHTHSPKLVPKRPSGSTHNSSLSYNKRCYLIFVVPCIMLYSGEISPTRCNNCVFIRNGFTLHVSGDNLTHHQEYNAVYGHR